LGDLAVDGRILLKAVITIRFEGVEWFQLLGQMSSFENGNEILRFMKMDYLINLSFLSFEVHEDGFLDQLIISEF